MIITVDEQNKQITPSTITYTGKRYVFLMNVQKEKMRTVKEAARLSNQHIIFVDNASDINADPLFSHYAVYVLQQDLRNDSIQSICNIVVRISVQYKQYLIDHGYDVKDVPLQDIYLGCEKHLCQF